jgi:L-arabinose isomerase
LQVHPLGIGGKADPARLVFNTPAGPALNASLMDFGNRFRLLVNEVDVVKPDQPMPRLPVAQAVWKCRPEFRGRLRLLDLRRWRAPYRLQPGRHHGNA